MVEETIGVLQCSEAFIQRTVLTALTLSKLYKYCHFLYVLYIKAVRKHKDSVYVSEKLDFFFPLVSLVIFISVVLKAGWDQEKMDLAYCTLFSLSEDLWAVLTGYQA